MHFGWGYHPCYSSAVLLALWKRWVCCCKSTNSIQREKESSKRLAHSVWRGDHLSSEWSCRVPNSDNQIFFSFPSSLALVRFSLPSLLQCEHRQLARCVSPWATSDGGSWDTAHAPQGGFWLSAHGDSLIAWTFEDPAQKGLEESFCSIQETLNQILIERG